MNDYYNTAGEHHTLREREQEPPEREQLPLEDTPQARKQFALDDVMDFAEYAIMMYPALLDGYAEQNSRVYDEWRSGL